MGQGSPEALPASGFRHLPGDKKPRSCWDFGQQEGIRSRGKQDNWAGPCGQGCGEARLGHQLTGAVHRAVAVLGMCRLASGQALTAPGAGIPSCTVAGGLPGAGRVICFQIFAPECKDKQNNQKPGFSTLL